MAPTANADPTTAPQGGQERLVTEPVVIDMDPGIDDALALQYLLGQGRWDLLAITAVGGNVPAATTFRNARGLAGAMGIADDVPVHRGCARPLSRRTVSTDVHGTTGLADLVLPDPGVAEPLEDAVTALLRLSHEYDGELTVIATGPLTNLAMAIVRDPDFATRVRRLVFMGGAAQVPGNASPCAEYNILVDPEAADIVVSSGLDWTMVGLDVTEQAVLTAQHRDRLARHGEGVALAVHLLDHYGLDTGGCHLHDPLAVGVASDPDFVRLEPGVVIVETASPVTLGATVFSGNGRPAPGPAQGRTRGLVALAMGDKDYVEDFLDVLPRWPAEPPQPEGT